MAVSPYVFAYSRRKAASAITADRSSEKRTRSFGACRSHMPSWAPKRRTSAPGTALARPLTRGIDPPLATKAGSLPRPSRSAVRAARYAGPSVAGSNPGPVSLGATVSGIPDGRRDSRWVTRRSRASSGPARGGSAGSAGPRGGRGPLARARAGSRGRRWTGWPSTVPGRRRDRPSARRPVCSGRLPGPWFSPFGPPAYGTKGPWEAARRTPGKRRRAGLSPSGRPSAGPRSHPTCRPEAWP